MSKEPIFTDWKPEFARLWGNVSLKLSHRLAEHPLFTDAALAKLIETYPKEHYQLMQPAMVAGGKSRDGDISGVPGAQVLEAIGKGRLWINMRQVDQVDTRYAALMREIFAEIRDHVPGFETLSQTIGILVSSPGSQTHYHADLPGQSLFQIRGQKRLYLYPPVEPFLSREQLERITISRKEFIAYERWYDEHAKVTDLEPGDMVHWPLNAPHRVDNLDSLNVSMTMEFFTPAIRRKYVVNRANAILRSMKAPVMGTATSGPTYAAKLVLQRALRDTRFVRSQDEMAARRPSFRPDPTQPNGVAELAT